MNKKPNNVIKLFDNDIISKSSQKKKNMTHPTTAEDYLKLAENSVDRESFLRYISMASKLANGNLYILDSCNELTSENEIEYLASLKKILTQEHKDLAEVGMFEKSPSFLKSDVRFGTYIYLYEKYIKVMSFSHMWPVIIPEAEYYLSLGVNELSDIRYLLIAAYVITNKLNKALKLYNSYNMKYSDPALLLYIVALYFRQNKPNKASLYLRKFLLEIDAPDEFLSYTQEKLEHYNIDPEIDENDPMYSHTYVYSRTYMFCPEIFINPSFFQWMNTEADNYGIFS